MLVGPKKFIMSNKERRIWCWFQIRWSGDIASSHSVVMTRDTCNWDREKSSGQTHLFNVWTLGAMDRTSGQPQVNLSLLRSISLFFWQRHLTWPMQQWRCNIDSIYPESREWIIEGQAFCFRMIWFPAPLPFFRQQVASLSQSFCVSLVVLKGTVAWDGFLA